jgi:hypothetical protein
MPGVLFRMLEVLFFWLKEFAKTFSFALPKPGESSELFAFYGCGRIDPGCLLCLEAECNNSNQ